MMRTLSLSTCVAIALITLGVGVAHALVRDAVEINIQGQTRILRLMSDDARIERRTACGANPTGVKLEGSFRLEMARPDGSTCGKLALGKLAFDHGDGWDRRKVLIPGDYNGDGHAWEVSFEGGGACSIGADRSVAGYDGDTSKLVRYGFRLEGSTATQAVNSSRYPAAVCFSDGYLRVRCYTNAADHPPYGWIADLFLYDRRSKGFRFVKTVQDVKPEPWPEWPMR